MTLKEAFEAWAKEPQFKKLAGPYRQPFTNVFLKQYSDVDIKTIDLKLTKEMVAESSQLPVDKIKACAALIFTLQHAGRNGHCTNPGFHTNDVFSSVEPSDSEGPKVKVKPEAKAKRLAELAKRTAKPAKKRKISKSRKVVQLDPKSYEPLRTFANAGEAGRAVGSTNILRAVKSRSLSAGYYWAYECDVKDFKPSALSLRHSAAILKPKPKPALPAPEVIEAAIEDLDAASDRLHEQQEEMEAERRAKAEILAEYTNDELLCEIRRRDWKGNVIIPINFDL